MATISDVVNEGLRNAHSVKWGYELAEYWRGVAEKVLQTPPSPSDYELETDALSILQGRLYNTENEGTSKKIRNLRLNVLVDWYKKAKEEFFARPSVLPTDDPMSTDMRIAASSIGSIIRDHSGSVKDIVGDERYDQILDMVLKGYLSKSLAHYLTLDAHSKLAKDARDPKAPPIPARAANDIFSDFVSGTTVGMSSPVTPEKLEDLKAILLKMEDRKPNYGYYYNDVYAAQDMFRSFPELPKSSTEMRTAMQRLVQMEDEHANNSGFPSGTLRILTKFRPDEMLEFAANPILWDKVGYHVTGALNNTVDGDKLREFATTQLENVSPENAQHIADLSKDLASGTYGRGFYIDNRMAEAAKKVLTDHNVDAIGDVAAFRDSADGEEWESFKNNRLIDTYLKNPTDENFKSLGKGLSKKRSFGQMDLSPRLKEVVDTFLEKASSQGAIGSTSYIDAINSVDKRFVPSLMKRLLETNHTHYTNSQKGVQTITPERKDVLSGILHGLVHAYYGTNGIQQLDTGDAGGIFHEKGFDDRGVSSSDVDYEDSLRDLVGHFKSKSESNDPIAPVYGLMHDKFVNYNGHDLSHAYAVASGKLVVPTGNQAHEVDQPHRNGIAIMQVQPQTSGLRAIRSMLNERGALSVKDVSAKLNPFRRTEQNESFVPDWDQFLDADGNISIDKLEAHKEKIAGTPQARSAIPKIDKVIQHLQSIPKPDEVQAKNFQDYVDDLVHRQRFELKGTREYKDLQDEIEKNQAKLAPHKPEYLPPEMRNGFPVKKKVVTENKLIDWSPISVGGNIHPDKLEEAIAKSPIANVGFHTGTFVLGAQQHEYGPQKVLTLDITPEQIKKLKDEGLYEDYQSLAAGLPTVMHPQNRAGLGWIRWTERTEDPNNPKQPLHIHIDEVQSDWDDQIKDYVSGGGEDEARKGKRIREILFHGHEPGELIHETFQQHIRNNHDVENKPVVWAVWDKESKKKMRISGLSTSRPPPVDWHTNYQEHPIAMGGKPTKYSNTAYVLPKGTQKIAGPNGVPLLVLPDDYTGNPNVSTSQTNKDLQGEPMYEGLVHKFEEFIQFFDKLQKEEGQSVSQIEKMIEGMLDASGKHLIESVPLNSERFQEEVKKFQDLIDQLPHIKSSNETARDDVELVFNTLLDLVRFHRNTEDEDIGHLREELAVSVMKYALNNLDTVPKSNKTATNALNSVLAAAYQYQGFTGFGDEALQDRFFREGVIHNPDRNLVLTGGPTMRDLLFRKLEEIADNPNEPPIPLSALEILKNGYVREHEIGKGPENKYLGLLRKVMPRTVDDLTSDSTGLALLKKVVMAPENMKWLSDSLEKAGKSMTPDVVRNVIAATSKEIDDSHQYALMPVLDRTLSQMFPDQYAEAMLVSPLAPRTSVDKFSKGLGYDVDQMLHHIRRAVSMSDLSPEERKVMVERARGVCQEELSDGIEDPVTARFLLDHYMKTGEDIIGNADLNHTNMQMQYFNFKKDKLLKEFQENPNRDTARALQDIRIPDRHVSREDRQALRDSVDKQFEDVFAAYAKSGVDADAFNDALGASGRAYIKHPLLHRAIEEKNHDLMDKVSDYAPDTESARRVLGHRSYDGLKSLTDRDLTDHVEQFMKEKKERFEATPIANRTSQEVRRHQLSMGILATYLSEKGRLIVPESNRAHTVQPEFKQGIGFIDVQPHSSGLRAIRTKLKEMGGKLLSIKDVSAKLNPFRRTEEKESMVDDWTPFENENGNLSIEKLQNYREYVSTTPQARSVVPKLDRLMDYIINGQPEIEIKSSDLPPQLRSSPVKKKVVNSSTVVDWNPISHSGNIHPQKLDEAIAQSPSLKVGYHLGMFILGAQQHTKSPQRVMVLNVTPEQIQKIRDEGLFDVYDNLRGQLPRGSHPQNKSGLGWVRWTQQGDEAPDSSAPVHMHIDEVQSDWDGTPASLAGQVGVYEPITPDRYHPFHTMNDENKAKASANTKKLLEDYAKIRKILFQGMEPGQLIHEALQQHVRNTFDVEKKPILWSVWSKKSKKKMGISGLDVNREPPVDWNVAYNQHPVAMGGEEEQYSQHVNRTSSQVPPFTPTSQTNPALQGEPTIGGKVHKSEGLDREEIKLGVKTEMEHTKNPKEALKIALDHLNEDPRYYSKARECGLIKFDLFLR